MNEIGDTDGVVKKQASKIDQNLDEGESEVG